MIMYESFASSRLERFDLLTVPDEVVPPRSRCSCQAMSTPVRANAVPPGVFQASILGNPLHLDERAATSSHPRLSARLHRRSRRREAASGPYPENIGIDGAERTQSEHGSDKTSESWA